jgi:hydroxymethylglutaryl-CoA synthase
MRVGIEKIDFYAGWLVTDAVELARAQGRNPEYLAREIMVDKRAVIPIYEDAVTLAVNAAKRLLSQEKRQDIDLAIVATESGVDFGKPISTWVHRFCELQANCRNFEVKHACYGATAALKIALSLVSSAKGRGQKVLIISTDLTRPNLADGLAYIGGGCAVAMLVSANPQILEVDPEEAGYWTYEIPDTFRPTAREEIGDNQGSLYSYLDALDGAYEHFERVAQLSISGDYFKKHIYHTPFPGMALQAHRSLLGRIGIVDDTAVRVDFDTKVVEGLNFAKRIGTAYGASNFVSLLGLLHFARDLEAGDRVSVFAYGSGCQAEFYSSRIGPCAIPFVRSLEIDRYLDQRLPLSVDQFEQNENTRARYIDCPNYEPLRDGIDEAYEQFYQGKGWLVLKRVKDFRREYAWS